MARLQRKKKPGIRKTRGTAEDQTAGAASSPDAASPALPQAGAAKEARRKPAALTKPVVVKEKKGYLQQALQFLREVKIELKKVTWPTRKQTLGSTVVVIVLVLLISIFLGLCDMGLSGLFRSILK